MKGPDLWNYTALDWTESAVFEKPNLGCVELPFERCVVPFVFIQLVKFAVGTWTISLMLRISTLTMAGKESGPDQIFFLRKRAGVRSEGQWEWGGS